MVFILIQRFWNFSNPPLHTIRETLGRWPSINDNATEMLVIYENKISEFIYRVHIYVYYIYVSFANPTSPENPRTFLYIIYGGIGPDTVPNTVFQFCFPNSN